MMPPLVKRKEISGEIIRNPNLEQLVPGVEAAIRLMFCDCFPGTEVPLKGVLQVEGLVVFRQGGSIDSL